MLSQHSPCSPSPSLTLPPSLPSLSCPACLPCSEIKARAIALERSGRVGPADPESTTYVGIQRHKRKLTASSSSRVEDPTTFTWEGKLIYRRKWFYLGRFKSQLEAAVA